MLCQIEVVARYEPLLILSCQNTALRDTVLQHLADRSINCGRDTRVPLSVARAEETNNSGRPQWFLPIEVNDSRTATFETIQQFFQKIGTIPEADLIGNKKDTASKRAMIAIHDTSDPWLKKYAMSQEGHMKSLLSAELVYSHEECSICQEIVQQNQSLPKGFISESAGEPAKDVTPVSQKSISSLPQMSDGEAVHRPPKKYTSTALDTKNFPDKPRVQRAERKGNNAPWKIPTAHPGSLADATTVYFLELDGKQRVRAAMGDELVKNFDHRTDANSLEPSHKEKVSALHDKHPGVIPVSSRTNQPAHEHYKHHKQEEVNFNKLPNGVTESAKSEPVGKNDPIKGQMKNKHQVLRSRKHRAGKKKAHALDLAIPAIVMGPGDVKLGVECQDGAEETPVEPKPQRGSHEGSEAEGEAPPRDDGAGNKSGCKRRSRTKRRVCPSHLSRVSYSTTSC